MPYSGPGDDSLPDNIKDLPEDDRAQWVEVWNSAYASCIDDGGEPGTCESSAFAQANGVVLKEEERGTMDAIHQLYTKIRDAFAPFLQQRSMALGRVYQQVDTALYNLDSDGDWPWLLDIYLDDGAIYALTAAGGLLYRYPVTVDGETVTLGERQQVTEVHQPVAERGMGIRVHRQADGRYRFTLIAATAVLNRVGEIDSRELFENFVRRAEESGEYPLYMFYHQGDRLRIGQVDFLAVDDAAYIASGLYDDEAENRLAGAARRRAQDEPDYWGNSIGFNPIGDPDMVEIADGVRVPVFRDGVNVEISMLPEQDAAAWFTALRATSQEVRMNQKTKDALERLLADDPDALAEFEDLVDRTNERAAERITRDADAETEPPAAETTTTEPPAPETPQEPETAEPETVRTVELDGDALDAIVARVIESEAFRKLGEALDAVNETLEALGRQVAENRQRADRDAKKHRERLEALELDEDKKRGIWLADQSTRQYQRLQVGLYRPRDAHAPEDGEQPALAEVAAGTLSNMDN